MTFADTLRQIDYQSLPISDYSRRYIQCLLPSLDYYLDICNRALDLALKRAIQSSNHSITFIDYGGGHGFLSLLAKQRGIERVVYIDYNPQASETVTSLADKLGFGPDIVLTGDSSTLKRWCKEQNITPNILVGIDVIEHIYRLDTFFADLRDINPHMTMVFSTASTPYNPRVVHRLHRIMRRDELGNLEHKGFLEMRREFIATQRPELSPADLNHWATSTRGLTYDDIAAALRFPLSTLRSPLPTPNTCDPATGSWTERILPLKAYRTFAAPRQIKVRKGFYNSYQHGIKGIITRTINLILHMPLTRSLAPFIILEVK